MPDVYDNQAAKLVSILELSGKSTVVQTLAKSLRSGKTAKVTRDSFAADVRADNPALYDALTTISSDLETVEDLVRIIVAPETPNEVVDFYTRLTNDPLYQLEILDEFVNGGAESGEIGELGWSFSSAGTAGTVNNQAAEKRHYGLIRIACGAASASVQALHLGGVAADVVLNADDIHRSIAIIRLGSTITSSKTRFGFFLSAVGVGTAITDGIYFEYTSSDGLWHGVCRVGSVETRINGPTAVLSQWEKLEIYRLSDGSVDFFISDLNIGNISTNVPADVGLNTVFAIEATSAAAKNFDVDYFRLTGQLLPYNERFT
jgi:hypothetical protein